MSAKSSDSNVYKKYLEKYDPKSPKNIKAKKAAAAKRESSGGPITGSAFLASLSPSLL